MCGQLPQGRVTLDRTLSALPPLDAVPVGLPAQLLRRRPDVYAAECRVAAATERIGVSMADRYPDLALNAGLGFNSNEFEKLLDWKYRTLLAAAQVSAPIFNAGRLRAGVQAAEAAAQEATQRYVGTVLKAVQEVEDALAREQTLTEQLAYIKDQFQWAGEAERLSRDRYARGVDTILVVLESERQRRLAETQVALAEGDLWRNRVALFLALGGDWGLEKADIPAENGSIPVKSP
jgi:outer membrane protein TolC